VPGLDPARAAKYRAEGHWRGETLDDVFRAAVAARSPGDIAVVQGDNRLTWGELAGQVSAVAAGLAELGVGTGDVVSVQLPNWPEFVVLNFAAARVGAVLNSLPATFRHQELEYILSRARPKVYVVPRQVGDVDFLARARTLQESIPELDHIVVVRGDPGGAVGFDRLLEATPTDLSDLAPGGDNLGFLVFTSGTEARPKGVLYTHNILNFSVRSVVQALGVGPDDVIFMPSPLASTTGVLNGMDMLAMLQTKLVLLERWNPMTAADLIEQERCAFTFIAATFLHDLTYLDGIARRDMSSFRLFACGGSPIPVKLAKDAERILGCRVLRAYGASEQTFVVINRPGDRSQRAYTTEGPALPAREIRILDSAGRPLPPGQTGEIACRGPNVAVGYFGAPELNARSFDRDGFYHSGDLGVLDGDGYLTVVGRKKEMIIRGGMNISPLEIETQLAEHPGVSEAAVVGYPDGRLGERACAFVVPSPGAMPSLAELSEFLLACGMAKYKLPERLEIVDALPRTPVGKVHKPTLSARFGRANGDDHGRRQDDRG
jgi:non-ribosomal peptide synthetase component E (peptide arylation enzyme)